MLALATISCGAARKGGDTKPRADDLGVVVLDRGAPPRHALRYPQRALDHAVSLTWSASSSSTGGGCLGSHSSYAGEPERTVAGTLRGDGVRRARFDLLTGTTPPSSYERAQLLGSSIPPQFEHELPASLEIVVEPRRWEVRPVADEHVLTPNPGYRRMLLAALPRALPREALGNGARWQVISVDDAGVVMTMTWHVDAIDGAAVTLVGSRRELTGSDGGSAGDSALARSWVHTALDLASFAVDAQVESSEGWSSWSGYASASGGRGERGTLTIAPR